MDEMMKLQDNRRAVRTRTWMTLLAVVTVALLLFLATSLSHLHSDWTEGQIYTLSDSTLSVVEKLEEPILIRAYITSGLPQPYGRLKVFIEDMLRAYHEAGHGNLGFEVIDPSGDANQSMALNAMKIPKVQVQVVEDDQAQVKQGYLAIVIEYLDSKEIIPVVQSEEGFEYLLTRKIKKLTGKGRSKIGILSGFGAAGLYQLRRLQELVRDDYELVEVDGEKDTIPSDISVMVVAGMEKQPSESFRYHLDQFRMQEGHGLLLLAGNAKPMLSNGFHVQPVDANANSWLKEDLGVAIDPGLVMDQQATRVTVNQQQGGFMFRSLVEYPFLPNVTNLNSEHLVTAGLESVSIPFASPLIWMGSDDVSVELMRSSARASVQSGPPFDVSPLMNRAERFSGMSMRSSLLALAVDGAVESAFKQPPESLAGKSASHITHADTSRMVVVGSPALLDDEFIDGGNLVALLNMFDWLSGDAGLIELRSRGVTQRPLESLSSAGRSFFKGVWMFALPVLIGLFGLWRWLSLKKRRAIRAA